MKQPLLKIMHHEYDNVLVENELDIILKITFNFWLGWSSLYRISQIIHDETMKF